MSLEELIATYGYLAILVITFIEGRDHRDPRRRGGASRAARAALGHPLGRGRQFPAATQFCYYVGRHWGPKIIAKRLSWQEGAQKVYKHLHRHQYFLILTFRFYYGLRNVTPFAVGSAHMPRLRFLSLNLIGAIVWAITFAYAGYGFGEASQTVHR